MEELNLDGMLEDNVYHLESKKVKEVGHEGMSSRAIEMLDNAKKQAIQIAKAKSFISDNYIKVTPNTAILIAAPAGRGKTTALYSAVVHELKRGGKVLFFSNEMGQKAIDAKVLKVLSTQLKLPDQEVAARFAHKFIIYHVSKHPALGFFDRAYDFIRNTTIEQNPDLVVFDQMSNMKKNSKSGERTDQWKALPEFTENFVKWQQSDDGVQLPPIVLIQQANMTGKKDAVSLQAALRGSKGTIADVGVGILIVRNAENVSFLLDKARDDNVVLNGCAFETAMVFQDGVYKPLMQALNEENDL